MSEYLYKLLQPQLDDALFVGRGYESAFDEFEILIALASAHMHDKERGNPWGPIGRFGWKHHNHTSPLSTMIERAKAEGDRWAPFQAGLFGTDIDGFLKSAEGYQQMVSRLHWY